jgi:L-ascorbate metabolism protein UlaG (beta-lactamase superfamily)
MTNITFLSHSGFLVETETDFLAFDVWKDPAGALLAALPSSEKPICFFVSHVHADHFSSDIFRWRERASYVLHRDCQAPAGCSVHFMDVGETVEFPSFSVNMYGSTDAGGSFLLKTGGRTIFHAGDLNWWHWAGENDADNLAARDAFFDEVSRISETDLDILFFPVDARQALAREWGVSYFLSRMKRVGLLVPMHAFGVKWCPSYRFRARFDVPLWIPSFEGDSVSYD